MEGNRGTARKNSQIELLLELFNDFAAATAGSSAVMG
jgi:hypothetical protein